MGVDDEQTIDRGRQRRKTLINEDVLITINMLEIGLRVVRQQFSHCLLIRDVFFSELIDSVDHRSVVPIGNGLSRMMEKVTLEQLLS